MGRNRPFLAKSISKNKRTAAVVAAVLWSSLSNFGGAKVSMHSWRGHALKIVRVLFRACVNVQDSITKALKIAQTK